MSLPAHISRVVLETLLDLLFPLLLTAAGGNEEDARLAAVEMLAEYRPNSAEELGLAGEIIAFRLKALGAMRDSARPGPLYASKLDLMKVANTLRRSESAAQRKLDALQRARRAAMKQAGAEPQPDAEPAVQAEPAACPPEIAASDAAPPAPPAPLQGSATPAPAPTDFDAFVQQLAEEFAANGEHPEEALEAMAEMAKAFSRGLYGNALNGPELPGSAPANG